MRFEPPSKQNAGGSPRAPRKPPERAPLPKTLKVPAAAQASHRATAAQEQSSCSLISNIYIESRAVAKIAVAPMNCRKTGGFHRGFRRVPPPPQTKETCFWQLCRALLAAGSKRVPAGSRGILTPTIRANTGPWAFWILAVCFST